MRVIKEASVRKNEILNAASVLFTNKGFENTSVTEIMNAVGIAKGTLYHHFKSKEEIMDALIERQTDFILQSARKVAEDKSIPVKERMIRTILALHIDAKEDTEGKEMIEHLHKPQNALMHQKTKRVILQNVPPIMAGIVEDGIAQKIFHTPYPLVCMEIAMCYLNIMLDDDVFELTQEQLLEKIHAFLFCFEKLLGTEKGELAFYEDVFLKGKDITHVYQNAEK